MGAPGDSQVVSSQQPVVVHPVQLDGLGKRDLRAVARPRVDNKSVVILLVHLEARLVERVG